MTSPSDRELSAVERMLADRTLQPLPPELRTRVLAAVDDALQKKVPEKMVPATRSGHAAKQYPPDYDPPGYADLVAGTVLIGTALSLLIIAILSGEAASLRIGDTTERPLLSFAQRAEAAGITLDAMPPSTVQLAGGLPYETNVPQHRDTLQVLDTRSFLQGDL